jgi:type VI secretion system protein VasG
MGADISYESVAGKLNRLGYEAFLQGLRQAKNAGNRNLELGHWMLHLLQKDRTDLALSVDHYKLSRAKLLADATGAVNDLKRNQTEMPGISNQIAEALDRGWHYATLLFGETQIRTGYLLVAMLKTPDLRRALIAVSKEFSAIPVDDLVAGHRSLWAASDEDNLRPMDGSGVAAASAEGTSAAPGAKGTTALARFTQDLTAKAKAGGMDPILGRDEEVRQIIDVLMRRRQNNPILTGEAGVGKTAVVEGFAQRIVAGEVPPPLRGVRLCALDIGLLQAGASMKGEFEQRLRSVIDEVQSSPMPVILFIDEAHTLIGAGGAAGTGDAANLLKPALARGTLRTIAATTWAEYRQYFEKDPALTRRFQAIQINEPSVATATVMLRGLVGAIEQHHKVRVTDEAIVAAVNFSHRYIPARQLPDKAVSLLDTACARVAVSQHSKPAAIEDTEVAIAALEDEKTLLARERDLGLANEERIAEIDTQIADRRAHLASVETDWAKERALVEEILALRGKLAPSAEPTVAAETEAARGILRERFLELGGIAPDKRMIHAEVDEQAVATVVSDWTGIPVGKMVADEVETVLRLAEILNRRIVGQSHGLSMIAKRIETNRAKLDNPNKPIGVFMLCGPSGVGKTETALALAETLYGGEQNIVTINMSEFQEAHSVATLKGSPPGYVGYGEGGRLTEAVRRRPYCVILLDEIEKAHPDVHEIFFQVFDKGMMEDGAGRRVDFKNTLILLTTNVGTEVIMDAAMQTEPPEPEALAVALRPALLAVFPPALLGRIVTIPYYPLTPDMLAGIVRLQLGRIGKRIEDNHRARFVAEPSTVDHIVSLCNDPDSGGRVIDNVITNTILPALSREILKRSLAREEIHEARISVSDGGFVYQIS